MCHGTDIFRGLECCKLLIVGGGCRGPDVGVKVFVFNRASGCQEEDPLTADPERTAVQLLIVKHLWTVSTRWVVSVMRLSRCANPRCWPLQEKGSWGGLAASPLRTRRSIRTGLLCPCFVSTIDETGRTCFLHVWPDFRIALRLIRRVLKGRNHQGVDS